MLYFDLRRPTRHHYQMLATKVLAINLSQLVVVLVVLLRTVLVLGLAAILVAELVTF
jgi:hypothetical protein